jgi:Histidine biosynthesis protein
VSTVPGPATPLATPGSAPKEPRLVPCLLLRDGRVCLPGPDGPVAARTPAGEFFDPFDVVDRLSADYRLLYVVDLDGIEQEKAQLDYLQELSREMTLWVDAGVRTADQAIDVIVTGARRAVLSTAYLLGPRELRRAWRLSTQYAVEVELNGAQVSSADTGWETHDPYELLRSVREIGYERFVLSPRGADPDWSVIPKLTSFGRTWIDGTFTPADAPRLAPAGAAGGIFHLDGLLLGQGAKP